MNNHLVYRFHNEHIEDEFKPGQWVLFYGQLEHPDGALQEAWCQGSPAGGGGFFAVETLEDENGDRIFLPKGAELR